MYWGHWSANDGQPRLSAIYSPLYWLFGMYKVPGYFPTP
jgi:hypothetical protein